MTRYYDPEIGRFVNADQLSYLSPETLNGCNLFAYCNNNPVMCTDPTGTSFWDGFFDVVRVVSKVILYAGAGISLIPALQGVGAIMIAVGGVGLLANDIYQLASGNIQASYNSQNASEIQIWNSSKLFSGFAITAYSIYLKYFSEYKDFFQGSAGGIAAEWIGHNLAYDALSVIGLFTDQYDDYRNSAKHADIGFTIFEESRLPFRFIFRAIEGLMYPISYLFDSQFKR